MKKVKISPRNYMVTIALAAAALAYVFLVFLPAQASISQLRTEIQNKRQYIAEADRLVLSIDQTRQRLLAVQRFNASWKKDSPTAGQLSPVLAAISQAAADAGVTIVRLEPRPEDHYETVSRAEILLVCEGGFAPLTTFIHAIETHPCGLCISTMDLAGGEAAKTHQPETNAGASMQASLNLAVFADKTGSSD